MKKRLTKSIAYILVIILAFTMSNADLWRGGIAAYAGEEPGGALAAEPGSTSVASAESTQPGVNPGGDPGEGVTAPDPGDGLPPDVEPGEEPDPGTGENSGGAEISGPDGIPLPEAGPEDGTGEPLEETPGADGTVESVTALAESDPITISSADMLAAIGEDDALPLNGEYILSGDIDLGQDWTPIGAGAGPFTGVFDGNGFTISGLYTVQPDGYAGLFSSVGAGAVIQNITIAVDYVYGGLGAGALAGQSGAAAFKNCYVIKGTGALVESGYQAGGLVGVVSGDAAFTECGSAVDVSSQSGWAGGLIGYMLGKSQTARAGIEKCYAIGAVSQTSADPAARGAGGLVGFSRFADIKNSYATGDVSSQYWYSGGLAGNAEYTNIEKCMASGNVRSYSAGCAGIAYGAGSLSTIRDSVAANKYLAVFDLYSSSNTITTSTPASSLSGNIYYAFVAYEAYGDTSSKGTPKSIDQLRVKSAYTELGWDFGNVWDWDSANACPKLRAGGAQPADTLNLSAQAPRITSQPWPQIEKFASEKLELSVAATGTGLKYQWYRDGAPLTDSEEGSVGEEDEVISGAQTAKLVVDNTGFLPSSRYVVTIENSYGGTVSRRSTVFIRKGASEPVITEAPQDQVVAEGERAVFSVTAGNLEGEVLSYRWEKSIDNGTTWIPVPRAMTNTCTTTIQTKADSGSLYRCLLTNTYGPTSKTVKTTAAAVTVIKAIKSIEINEEYVFMKPGEKRQLTAKCLPEDAEQDKTVVWDIGSGSTFAYVNAHTGEVEAVSAGTASVLAISEANSDICAVCFIVIREDNEPDPSGVSIFFDGAAASGNRILDDLYNEQGLKKTVTLTASEPVTWKSSDKNVATINSNGQLKYVGSGTVVITATGAEKRKAVLTLTIRDLTPKLPVNTITVYSLSTDGTPVTMLQSDNFPFDDVSIKEVTPAPVAGAFDIVKSGTDLWDIRAPGVPKGKYTLQLTAMKDGEETGSVFKITANVKSAMPAATVKLPSLNTFYIDSVVTVRITGANLPKIDRVELVKSAKAADGDVTQNFGIYEDGGEYILYCKEQFGSLIKGKPAVKGVIEIWYSGYSEPFSVKVTIPAKSTPPKVKFTKATRTIDPANGLTVEFNFSGGAILDAQPKNVDTFDKYYDSYDFDASTVTLTLGHSVFFNSSGKIKSAAVGKTYTTAMYIWLKDARAPISLKANIKTVKSGTAPKFGLTTQSVTVNKRYEGQRADIGIVCNQYNANYTIKKIYCNEFLDIEDFGDLMTVMAGSGCRSGKYACKVVISCKGKLTVLPFSVTVADKPVTVSLGSKTGKIDLNDRENTFLSYKPKLNNYRGAVDEVWIIDEGDEDNSVKFSVSLSEKGRVEIRANAGLGYDEDLIYGKTYKVKLGFQLEAVDASDIGEPYVEEVSGTVVSVKPVRSQVKHNLSTPLTMYASKTSAKGVVDLTPLSPKGAMIDVSRFNIDNSDNKYFYLYLGYDQKLNIMLRDDAYVKPGSMKLVLPVTYEGQSLSKSGDDYYYKSRNISVNILIKR